jgi:hypothetical protein
MKYIEPNPAIEGWMSNEELQWLFDKGREMENIVEVGSWMGKSTHAFLSTAKPVVAVDHFLGSASQIDGPHIWAKTNDLYAAFKRNVGHFSNLTVMKMDSVRASQFFRNRSIGMVFIDGDHEMALTDIQAWLPKCKHILAGHDRNEGSVPKAIREIPEAVNINLPGSLWSIEI